MLFTFNDSMKINKLWHDRLFWKDAFAVKKGGKKKKIEGKNKKTKPNNRTTKTLNAVFMEPDRSCLPIC